MGNKVLFVHSASITIINVINVFFIAEFIDLQKKCIASCFVKTSFYQKHCSLDLWLSCCAASLGADKAVTDPHTEVGRGPRGAELHVLWERLLCHHPEGDHSLYLSFSLSCLLPSRPQALTCV